MKRVWVVYGRECGELIGVYSTPRKAVVASRYYRYPNYTHYMRVQ